MDTIALLNIIRSLTDQLEAAQNATEVKESVCTNWRLKASEWQSLFEQKCETVQAQAESIKRLESEADNRLRAGTRIAEIMPEVKRLVGTHEKENPFKPGEMMIVYGDKIRAIKLVREKTSWGLKEAKDFVESL